MREDPPENAPRVPTREAFWVRAWPFLVFALLTAICYFPILASSTDEIIDTGDIRKYFYWLHQYSREHLLAGRLPLWNPYIYCGVPFAANPQASVFYLPSWIHLFVPVIHAHKWMIALHVFLAGAFMYLLIRRHGPGRVAATVGGLPWMLGGYLAANAAVGHLTVLFAAAWLPLILYFYDLALATRRRRWVFWTGFVLGIQFIAGEPQSSYYTALLLGVYGLVRTVSNVGAGEKRWNPMRYWRWAASLAVIALIAALTSAIQLFPTAEMATHSDRSANTYTFATTLSFPPGGFAGFIIPWSNESLLVTAGGSGHVVDLRWEFAGYVGILPLILAVISLGLRRGSSLRAAKVLLVVSVLLMLGRHTQFYRWLLPVLPGLRTFRIPSRAIVLAVCALSVMSAFGLDWLLQADSNRWRRGKWRIVAISMLLVFAGLMIVPVVFLDMVKKPLYGQSHAVALTLVDPMVLKPTLCILATLAVVVALRWLPRRVAVGCIAGLVALDLLVAAPGIPLAHYSRRTDPSIKRLQVLRDRLSGNGRPFRVDLSASHTDANAGMGARVENVNAYWPVALKRFYDYVHVMRRCPPNPRRRHQLLDAVYFNPDPFPLRIMNVRAASKFDVRLGTGKDKVWVKKKVSFATEFMPRAWVVDRAEVLGRQGDTLMRMQQDEFDPARTVILEKPPRIALAGLGVPPGRATVKVRDGGGLNIQTETSRDGYLVLSEIFYPGWRATVDGREVALERADYLISALPLPAGSHQVTYRYDPLSLKLGAVCTLLACLAAVGMLVASRRKLRRTGT